MEFTCSDVHLILKEPVCFRVAVSVGRPFTSDSQLSAQGGHTAFHVSSGCSDSQSGNEQDREVNGTISLQMDRG